eukprot:6943286-Alexandrium_andersonii.AAC.1
MSEMQQDLVSLRGFADASFADAGATDRHTGESTALRAPFQVAQGHGLIAHCDPERGGAFTSAVPAYLIDR